MIVSVVIPVYNAESTIIRCIDSVVQQDVENVEIEIIVVNDGSTDNSLSLIEDFRDSNNISNMIIVSKKNGGVSSARNEGIKIATGEWIAFIDSDDEWLKMKLRKQFHVINDSNQQIDFLGCARNNEQLSILSKKIDHLHKATVLELLVKMFPQTSTAIVRKSLLDKCGLYNEEMTHAEDGELWVRLCSRGNFYYLPESLVITGNGKPNFGHSGLSSNLREMQSGSERILVMARKSNIISSVKFYLLMTYYKLKYLRRILMVRFS